MKILSVSEERGKGNKTKYLITTDEGIFTVRDLEQKFNLNPGVILKRKRALPGGWHDPKMFDPPRRRDKIENPKTGINARREDAPAEFTLHEQMRKNKELGIKEKTAAKNAEYRRQLAMSVRMGSSRSNIYPRVGELDCEVSDAG
jgi:hypothetical protein